LNTWYYVAAVYNATARTMDVYVNGVLDNGALIYDAVPTAQVLPPVDTMIGKRADGFYFKGIIDNVRIYNSALSAAAIQADMNTPATTLVTQSAVPIAQALSAAVAGAGLPTNFGDSRGSAASLSQNEASGLTCTPKVIDAGSLANCELHLAASLTSNQIRVVSTSSQVKAPVAVLSRANQSSLTFQVSADLVARQQFVTVTATAGNTAVHDTIEVLPTSRPVLTVPGRQMAKVGGPIHFEVSAVDPADLPVQLTASGVPAGAAFDAATGRFEWTPATAQAGRYNVTFTAAGATGQSSSAQVPVDVTSGNPVLESAEQMCSPGAIASVKGSWLAESGRTLSDPSGKALDLGGTKVKINAQYVPVLLASSTKVQFLCPAADPGTAMGVAVETAAGVSEPLSMAMQSASPWIFSLDTTGESQGVVSFAGTTELAMARNPKVTAHPAQPGDEILIWGTGFGSSIGVSVKLDGLYAEVESIRAVPGYAGTYTIQVRVPDSTNPGDTVPIQLQVTGSDGKLLSSNSVTMAVEPVRQ
jgi:uncharacterized protein (TIGR03437 family)